MAIEGSRYAKSTEGRRVYIALEAGMCAQCRAQVLRGDLFTRGFEGDSSAIVCYSCRPFEIAEDTVAVTWRGITRQEYYLNI